MRVRIVGTDLPGRNCRGGDERDVHVGVQRKGEVEQLVPGDAAEARFELELRPNGDRDALGPYAHGKRGERFIYLSWVAGPDRIMFRRAKLLLADIPDDVWVAGCREGAVLEATLPLTDRCGMPLCARVPGDVVTWRAYDAAGEHDR